MLVGKEPLLFLSDPSTLALTVPRKFLFTPSRLEEVFIFRKISATCNCLKQRQKNPTPEMYEVYKQCKSRVIPSLMAFVWCYCDAILGDWLQGTQWNLEPN